MASLLCLYMLLLLPILLLACGYQSRFEALQFSGETMGTRYNVTAVVDPGGVVPEDLDQSIQGWLEAVNQSMSTYLPDSELSKLNEAPVGEWLPVSPMMLEVLATAEQVSEFSGGAFDITIAPLVDIWGFGPVETNNQVPSDTVLAEVKQWIGFEKLQVRNGPPTAKKTADVQLDLSAIAKGYAADYVGQKLEAIGLNNYLVEVGGDLVVSGHNQAGEPWRIGVEKPSFKREGVQQVVTLPGGGVATSGDYRNFFQWHGQTYSHILDPRLGRPVAQDLVSVTVIAESGARADALATAFTVMGAEESLRLAERKGIAVYLIARRDGELVTRQTTAFAAHKDEN